MQEGPNFREQPQVSSPKVIFKGIKRDVEQGLLNWAKFEGFPIEAFGEWKVKCLLNIKNRLQKIFYQNNNRVKGMVLERRDVIDYLSLFHSKYIITSIDKTTSNLGVVCKKFYIRNILEECGLWPGGGSDTYEISNQNKQGIINKLKQGVSFFGVKQSGGCHDELPYIYSIIKMHKTPIKFRYIISSRQCTTKPLARVAMLGLKECQKQNQAYCNAIKQYTGINMFFITDNFQKIASDIQHLNNRSKAKSISTYDFTSLYTKIQHTHLITNMDWYIDLAFKGANKRGKKFLSVYSKSANWVVKHHEGTCAFDTNTFKALIKFLINNAYFRCGDKILRQKIGIPMGLDPAPQMANAHLHRYEFDFQQKMSKTNYSVARSLNHTFRYIDDISPLNDNGNFDKFRSQIYPDDLELNRENTGYKSASVLEMQIDIIGDKFQVNVYDKRDNFGFQVFRYPSIRSNIPDKTLYNVFYSQLVRFSRVCNNRDGFISALKTLKGRVLSKGANKSLLQATFKRFWGNYNVNYAAKADVIKNVF